MRKARRSERVAEWARGRRKRGVRARVRVWWGFEAEIEEEEQRIEGERMIGANLDIISVPFQ